MSVERNEAVVDRYRAKAAWGGAFFGALIGAVGAAPFLGSSANAAFGYVAAIAGGAAVGACIGYLFFEIFMGHMAARGAVHSGSEPGNGGDGGDGG